MEGRLAEASEEGLGSKRAVVPMMMMIQKYGLSFVRLYFLNCTWYVNDLHNI
jgi:hypothetical protein